MRFVAVLAAMVLVMITELLTDMRQTAARVRLTRIRFALAAVWIAMLLAQPTAFGPWPLTFIGLLLLIALAAAALPIRSVTRTA